MAEDDKDGMPLFTKATKNPLATPDEAISRPILPHAYQDMRGNWWLINWTGKAWSAVPTKAAAAAYGLQERRMYAAGSDAAALIDGIEERLEIARVQKSKGVPWWLVLAALFFFSKKGRR